MRRLVAFMICAVSLGAEAQLPDYVPTDGLVGWWPFEGSYSNEYSGITPVDVSEVAFSEGHFGVGQSAFFNDAAYIELGDMPSPAEFTLTAWVKPSAGALDTWGNVYSDFISGSGGLALLHSSNQPFSELYSHTTLGSNGTCNTGLELEEDSWQFVAMTRNAAGEVQIYWNMQHVGNCQSTTLPAQHSQSAYIGRAAHSDTEHWLGEIDDFGFWSRVLNQGEMQVLYAYQAEAGCTDSNACNYDDNADIDDGSCLYTPQQPLESTIQLSNENNLAVAVPEGLQSWAWSDGDNDSLKLIQPNKEYVLNGVVGSVPSFGETMAGGVIFHIDTVNGKVLLASSEPIAYDIHWGCTDFETGAVATDIGDGISNTETILAACQQTNCAARVASEYGNGWFLPSRDELEAIRTRLYETGLVDYSSGNSLNWYWTSSECLTDFTDATDIQFATGFIHECNNKNSPGGGIIAVREEPSSFCFYSDTITVEVNETVLCDSVYNPDVDLDNFIGLQDILAILSYYNASWPPWQCGDPLEYQGYDYETVQIGEQCWFAENLRAENYGNGEAIPADLSDSEWTGTTEGAVSVYDGDMANLSTYGRLYNWYAVHDDRSLCPNNWSVPLDSDWLSLEVTLGMSNVEAATTGYRGSDQGMRMKATSTWADDGNGSNLTGFNAVGAGIKFDSGNYDFQGEYCYWWVRDTIVTVGTENEMYRELFKGSSQVGRGVNAPSNYGYSIRCIKD